VSRPTTAASSACWRRMLGRFEGWISSGRGNNVIAAWTSTARSTSSACFFALA